MFTNLLANAIKYNHRPKGEGIIEVSHRVVQEKHEFTIGDNGPGIPKNLQHRVFELFGKAHRSNLLDSTGVGLSIVQKLVERNGGAVSLESELGRGAVFVFTWRS